MATGLQYLGNNRGQMKSTEPLNEKIKNDSKVIPKKEEDNLGSATAISSKDLSIAFSNGEKISFPDFSVKISPRAPNKIPTACAIAF